MQKINKTELSEDKCVTNNLLLADLLRNAKESTPLSYSATNHARG